MSLPRPATEHRAVYLSRFEIHVRRAKSARLAKNVSPQKIRCVAPVIGTPVRWMGLVSYTSCKTAIHEKGAAQVASLQSLLRTIRASID